MSVRTGNRFVRNLRLAVLLGCSIYFQYLSPTLSSEAKLKRNSTMTMPSPSHYQLVVAFYSESLLGQQTKKAVGNRKPVIFFFLRLSTNLCYFIERGIDVDELIAEFRLYPTSCAQADAVKTFNFRKNIWCKLEMNANISGTGGTQHPPSYPL